MTNQPNYPSRIVLEGVPRAGYDIHLNPFAGSLYAILDYLGNHHDYDYLMGISGAPFRRLWKPEDGGNVGLLHFHDPAFRMAFEALGYEWQHYPDDKGAMITAIQESLARKVPPISHGILGPPEGGIVTGYDQDGAVLYGWSYFQPDPTKYYEKPDWFETRDPSGDMTLIVLGDKMPAPPQRQVLKTALEWAIDLECTSERPEVPEHVSGLSAYDAWADAMDSGAGYAGEAMVNHAMVYGDQCVMLEERRDAAKFLRRMKEHAPEATEHLEAAAALYDEVADQGVKLWPWPGMEFPTAIEPLSDERTRHELATHVRTVREREARAVTLLQQALAAMQ